MNAIETLNALSQGWTESRSGGLLCNPAKRGGIIDKAHISGKWFVVFADGKPTIEGIDSRDDAVEFFCAQYFA